MILFALSVEEVNLKKLNKCEKLKHLEKILQWTKQTMITKNKQTMTAIKSYSCRR